MNIEMMYKLMIDIEKNNDNFCDEIKKTKKTKKREKII